MSAKFTDSNCRIQRRLTYNAVLRVGDYRRAIPGRVIAREMAQSTGTASRARRSSALLPTRAFYRVVRRRFYPRARFPSPRIFANARVDRDITTVGAGSVRDSLFPARCKPQERDLARVRPAHACMYVCMCTLRTCARARL